MATKNLMSDHEEAESPSEQPVQASSWTFASLLGLDNCCAVASFSGVDQAQAAMADGVRTTSSENVETKDHTGRGGMDQDGSWEEHEKQQEDESSVLYNLSVLQGTNFSLMGHT